MNYNIFDIKNLPRFTKIIIYTRPYKDSSCIAKFSGYVSLLLDEGDGRFRIITRQYLSPIIYIEDRQLKINYINFSPHTHYMPTYIEEIPLELIEGFEIDELS